MQKGHEELHFSSQSREVWTLQWTLDFTLWLLAWALAHTGEARIKLLDEITASEYVSLFFYHMRRVAPHVRCHVAQVGVSSGLQVMMHAPVQETRAWYILLKSAT